MIKQNFIIGMKSWDSYRALYKGQIMENLRLKIGMIKINFIEVVSTDAFWIIELLLICLI